MKQTNKRIKQINFKYPNPPQNREKREREIGKEERGERRENKEIKQQMRKPDYLQINKEHF